MAFSIIIANENYEGLNPVQFGSEFCMPSHSFGPAVRTYWLIHFVVSGCGYFKIKDREYNLGPGEMFVIPPYVETYYEADKDNPWNYTWIGFKAEFLPLTLKDTYFVPEAEEIFSMMKKCQKMSNGISAYLNARLWDLFSLLLEKENVKTDYIERALAFIHAEYVRGITVEQIAKKLSLDRTYFSNMFKKKVGMSPKQYLTNYRMKIAVSLMLDKGYSVSVAACSVGYTDIFAFSKMFKKHFGISPVEYIKLKKG